MRETNGREERKGANRRQRRAMNALGRRTAKQKGRPMGQGWFDMTESAVKEHSRKAYQNQDLIRMFANDLVSVQVYSESASINCPDKDKFKGLLRVGIKRHDDEPLVVDWDGLQWLKNFLIGTERNAVEIFPVKKGEVNVANMRWLWVLPKGDTFGFGWKEEVKGEHYDHRKIKVGGQK